LQKLQCVFLKGEIKYEVFNCGTFPHKNDRES
jgi:hypothetical protein